TVLDTGSSFDDPNPDVGDFDQDGNRDIVYAWRGSSPVRILLGRGDGSFMPGQTYSGVQDPLFPRFVDIDNDGNTDVVLASLFGGDAIVLRNDGHGNLLESDAGLGTVNVAWLDLGDLNGDGFQDLIALLNDGTLVSLINDGHGRFGSRSTMRVPSQTL